MAPTSSLRRWTSAVLLGAVVAVPSAAVSPADAAGAPPAEMPAGTDDVAVPAEDELPLLTGPVVSLERDDLGIGEEIIVTLAGFDARLVNIAVCGNEARRGSGDCAMQGAKGNEIDESELTTRVRFRISEPPTPCPCLIRVASNGQSEIAVAPITLAGHPVAEPVDPPEIGPLVEADISVELSDPNPFDKLRTGLGGATSYDVRVSARNTLSTPLYGLSAAVTVGRGETDDLVQIDLQPIPDVLEPGQRWQQVVRVELPRPVWGDVEWRLLVSGAGPAVEATDATSNTPTVLFVLIGVLVLDIVYILFRMRRRKRRLREPEDEVRAGPLIEVDDDGTVWTLDESAEHTDDRLEPVGPPSGP